MHFKLCAVYGKDTVTERTCQICFRKFRSGNSSFQDRPRSGRPIGIDDGHIEAIIETDRHIIVREIGKKLNSCKTTIDVHLKS